MTFDLLANQLRFGEITLNEWKAGMREALLEEQRVAMILTRGGREFVTQADWGYVGSSVKKQYAFLDGFAADIQNDPAKWMTGRLNARAKLYKNSGYTALEDFKARDVKIAGWTQERRVLGGADNCRTNDSKQGCWELSKLGWKPIGSLPPIGAAPCSTNCRCHFQYRRPKVGGGWEIEGN